MFFFFNDTATTEIYTLSLHDALPISSAYFLLPCWHTFCCFGTRRLKTFGRPEEGAAGGDRKSTRLNSSHANISYAVFCLKKKKKNSSYLSSITSINQSAVIILLYCTK